MFIQNLQLLNAGHLEWVLILIHHEINILYRRMFFYLLEIQKNFFLFTWNSQNSFSQSPGLVLTDLHRLVLYEMNIL